jgi:hypothetical protein
MMGLEEDVKKDCERANKYHSVENDCSQACEVGTTRDLLTFLAMMFFFLYMLGIPQMFGLGSRRKTVKLAI